MASHHGQPRLLSSPVESSSGDYQYSTLSEGYIRILGLDRATGTSIVRGEIEEHPLDNPPEYIALSYCWGDSTLSHSIYIPEEVHVTANLHSALTALCRMTSVYVWADALCINQKDVLERNKQVLLMRQIYEKAKVVVIHLGGDEDNSRIIPQLIYSLQLFDDYRNFRQGQDGNLFENVTRKARNEQLKKELGFDQWVPGDNGFGWLDGAYQPDKSASQWKALRAFLKRPWFTRAWIIQEALACTHTLVMCGSWCMGLVHLMGLVGNTRWLSLYGLLEDDDHEVPMVHDALEQVDLIGGLAVDIWQGRSVPLLWLLQRCRRTQATLEIDRLYAIIGLSNEAKEPALAPDYGLLPHEVVRNYARFFFRTGQGIEMLKQVDIITWKRELPTWMPDWTTYNWYVPWLGQPGEPGRVVYRAGGDKDEASVREVGDKLVIGGFIFDKISELGQDHRSSGLAKLLGLAHTTDARSTAVDRHERSSIWASFSESIEMLEQSRLYRTPFERNQVASSTFMVGRIPPEDKPEGFYEVCYEVGRLTVGVLQGIVQVQDIDNLDPRCRDDTYWMELMSRMRDVIRYLRLCKTETGRLAQVPYGTEVGDVLAIFRGSEVPFVLRKHGDAYRLLGACYVHGVMDGQLCENIVVRHSNSDLLPTITLV